MSASAPKLSPSRAPRLQSIDAYRGFIMIIMAIDHVRDYVNREAMLFLPTDLTQTTPALFFTRWITHLCAPGFIFCAGLGAYLWMQRGHHTKPELSRFLLTRGLWLLLCEVALIRPILFFQFGWRGEAVVMLVFWSIGLSMIGLAALVYLPPRVLAALSVAIIALHDLSDSITADKFGHLGWLWIVLHQRGAIPFAGTTIVVGYPVLPWLGAMCAGFCLGEVFTWESELRKRFLYRLGGATCLAFVGLRAVNLYGDVSRWEHQKNALFTVLSFLNTSKYPPSLLFFLMTLGPAMVLLAVFEGKHFSDKNPMIVFGRVPFFYFAAHLLLAHLFEVALNFFRYGRMPFLWMLPPSMGGDDKLFPPGYGISLGWTYVVWLVVVVSLYPVCFWFSRLKQRRRDWWLSYL
ncbi:MAG TPA: heparan-alpha-glucosaminide N-acetyltransferase domain-containing protein [Candidatus Koribacter sp.]|jgi:uncharacterized membrane protein